jgi:dTDP-4-dehydrorhamnose reductase
MKVLVLGDGLLGSEIIKQTGWEYLSQSKDEIDVVDDFYGLIEKIDDMNPDVLVNCIGYTNTYDPEREKHWEINYKFVVFLVQFCDSRDIKLVHISTDYIYTNSMNRRSEVDIPVHQETWYSYCKLLADAYVQLMDNYLMFRCSFKPKPFPYEKAYFNVRGNFDYVDVIAKQMVDLINEERTGIWNIGTGYKSIVDLAKQTKPDIGEWYDDKLPSINMDLNKFNNR